METLIALLRGINVGRAKQVPMADLRRLVEGLGYEDVRTHLRSGNVVFRAAIAPDKPARAIEAAVADRFGLEVDVVVRTAGELAAIVADHPLAGVATQPARHQVIFLPGKPDPEWVRSIERRDFAPERVVFRDREIHAWCPGGVYDSALMKALTGRGAPRGTARNWNTVTRLLEMARPPG